MFRLYCQEDEGKPAESGEPDGAEKNAKENEQNVSSEKANTPSKETKEKEGRKGILGAIKLPLVSVFPRKKNKVPIV